ncbi:MAG: phosphoserine phosphatase RsbU/P [Clostridiales bacterium]|jgi:PAS domain S-box-containing protein|nr:phosphoserine phosphatase RsbU/P [Clostridiales bacterium]
MFSRFTLYIDLLTAQEDYAPILDVIERYTAYCEPITRVLSTGDWPDSKYDLLIIDAMHLPTDSTFLNQLNLHYEQIIVINVDLTPNILSLYYAHGIIRWLRKGYFNVELIALLDTYIREKRRQNQSYLLDNLFNSAQNTIVITDRRGNIEYANPYFEKLSGYSSRELISKSPAVIKTDFHDQDFYRALWETILGGDVWEGIFVNQSKYLHRFYEEATITPIRSPHGEIEKFLKIGRNITRERLLLDELSKEVRLARYVMNALLPSTIENTEIAFDYHITHYNQLGGDFIVFENPIPGKYHFALIDVTGHGVSSALISITIAQMFIDYMRFNPLTSSVDTLNRLLCKLNADYEERSKYMTGIFGTIDVQTGELQLVNAGHLDLLLFRTDGTSERYAPNNMMLGVLENQETVAYTIPLENVRRLFCFTDGLYENHGLDYDETLKKLEDLIGSTDKALLFEKILSEFHADESILDDITLCNIELKPQVLGFEQ